MQQVMELTEEHKKRFWAKVDKTDSCWLWTGSTVRGGYGNVCINNKTYMAHRVSWFLAGNTIPTCHVLRHKCRNRNCLNPEHLETGTQAENANDKIRDGTAGKKLNAQQVLEIRARATESQRKLGKEYGVSHKSICRVITRRYWKHI